MSIIEPGKDQFLAGIDNTRFGSSQSANFGSRAEGGNAVSHNGQRTRGWVGLIHGVDGGIDNQNFRRERRLGSCGRNIRHGERK